ncbi:hypothetical protein FJ981_28065 [Mesorhizobium sp. B1-1-4]|uniref:hypothetical protein n=1 Tax=Mesorhizobium sp. B1-1-4 TaxID=2589980 RepID=UPI0011296D95|nr:hypothetical protein [Mesorhizobium sp. B1-1-4]TPN44454.1 hypothetical protein FJ981_28065 [Mesorhizobium sp. B1-1-4]
MHPADKHFTRKDLPRGIVATCLHCKHSDVVMKVPKGSAGRGWGMREGNKQRGRMIQHIKNAHPEVLA